MIAVQNLSKEQLQNRNKILQEQLSQRDEKIVHLDKENTEYNQKIVVLEEQLNWFKRQLFGRRSERDITHVDAKQLELDGFESLPKEDEPKNIAAHRRRKPENKGKESIILPSDLPVETVFLDIRQEQKVCQETGVPLVKIGEETTLKLAYKPGSFYLKEIIRPKYAHPAKEEKGIIIEALPESLLTRCRADESFLAFILTKKFADHLPLYRICEGLQRHGIIISRKLLSQWVIRCGMALMPLYEVMRAKILASGNVFIDESPVRIQEKVKCAHGLCG